MGYLCRLSLTYLRKQRMRILMTLACLILAVYLMTGFGVLFGTALKTANCYTRAYGGSAHLMVDGLTLAEAQTLSQNVRVEEGGYTTFFSLSDDPDACSTDGTTGRCLSINDNSFSLVGMDGMQNGLVIKANPAYYVMQPEYGIALADGDYPQNDGEIMLSQHLLSQMKTPPQIGDAVTIKVEEDRLRLTPIEEADPSVRDALNPETGFYEYTKSVSGGGTYTVSLMPGFAEKVKALCAQGMNAADATRELFDMSDRSSDEMAMLRYFSQFEVAFGEPEQVVCTHTYRLSGTFRSGGVDNGIAVFAQDTAFDEVMQVENDFSASLELRDHTSHDLEAVTEGLSSDSGVPAERFVWNEDLLMTELRGDVFMTELAFLFVAVALLVIFLFFIVRLMIDNAFELSTKERIRQFGVLRTLGATKGQISFMLFLEATILSLIAVPAGFGLAIVTGRIAVEKITSFASEELSLVGLRRMGVALTPDMVQLGIRADLLGMMLAICIIGIYVSVFTSMYRMRRISASETLHYGKPQPPKKCKPGKRRRWLSRKLFGFPVGLASRNVRRNPKQYWVSVLSLSLSAMLFVVSASLISQEQKQMQQKEDATPAFTILQYEENTPEDTARLRQTLEPLCKQLVRTDSLTLLALDAKQQLSRNVREEAVKLAQSADADAGFPLTIYIVTRQNFALLDTSISYDELCSQKGILLSRTARVETGGSFGEPTKQHTETMISDPNAVCASYEITCQEQTMQMLVLGTYDTTFAIYQADGVRKLTGVIAAENADFVNLTQEQRYEIYADPASYAQVDEALLQWQDAGALTYDSDAALHAMKSTNLKMVGVVLGVVMCMLGLISVLNMVNTLLTGILNRRREYFMLRACGMSRAQLCVTVFSEGVCMLLTVLVLAGIPATVLLNLSGSVMLGTGPFLPVRQLLIVAACGLGLVALSSLQPLVRIGKHPIAQGIRELEE